MRELTKVQITVGVLSCFSIGLGSIQKVLSSSDILMSLFYLLLMLIAIFVLSFIILAILRWIGIFDLKTDAIITLLVLITPLLLLSSRI
ncbi:MAG: hypothetical protein QXS02_01455 [Candidatus Thermoplasmatota archaeon]